MQRRTVRPAMRTSRKIEAAIRKKSTAPMPSEPESSDRILSDAVAHLTAGRLREAEQGFRTVLDDRATEPAALHGLGVIALRAGHYGDALALFDRALAVAPALAALHVNRGSALKALRRFGEAVAALRRAIELQPDLFSAWNNIGEALQALGEIDAATEALEKAVLLAPAAAEARANLGNLYKEQGRIEAALQAYDSALAIDPYLKEAFSNKLAALKVAPNCTPGMALEAHRCFSAWFETDSRDYQPLGNDPDPNRKLRIGYVSPDCHSAVPAFIRPVLRMHDSGQFEVFCYFNNPQPPEPDAIIRERVTVRIMAGMTDERVAEQIRCDGIDILIDIAGHTGKNRLLVFARRPAPVQMTWLDYLSTTGLDAMDYRISDAVADPPGVAETFHSETLVRIVPSQWCWEPDADAPPVAALPALVTGFITFGSFNNYSKITDDTLKLWSELLHRDATARLVIAGAAEGRARSRVIDCIGAAASRVTFLPRLSVSEYRCAIGMVDIALDPLGFSGATTTLDALWQGVPVLTCPGTASASRSSASLLAAAGMKDWVAHSPEHYLDLALSWRDASQRLAQLRADMRERLRQSPLLDSHDFTQKLELLYRSVWQCWCQQRIDANSVASVAPIKRLDRCSADRLLLAAEQDIARQDSDAAIEKLKAVYRFQPNWTRTHAAVVQALLLWSRDNLAGVAAWPPALEIKPSLASVSVIICSIDDAKFARTRARYENLFSRCGAEVIRIADARSLCEGYNRGAAQARGEILVFSHDDIEIVNEDFADRLLAHMSEFDVVGVAGTSRLLGGAWDWAGAPHLHGQIIHRPPGQAGYVYLAWGLSRMIIGGIEALDGVMIAARRQVWDKVRFDAATFDGFHLYDVDFSYRCFLERFRLAVANDLLVIHESTGRYDRLWQQHNLRFQAKFRDRLTGIPNAYRASGLNVKLQQLEQVQRLRAALAHFRFPDFE
jgi:predicted O-linked N-acetylglucosamine transferase (SPINDLY family)